MWICDSKIIIKSKLLIFLIILFQTWLLKLFGFILVGNNLIQNGSLKLTAIVFAGFLLYETLVRGVKINLLHYMEFYLFLCRTKMIIKVIVLSFFVGVFEERHTTFHLIYNSCIFIRLSDAWLSERIIKFDKIFAIFNALSKLLLGLFHADLQVR